jgi:hypothetical protein
MIWLCDEVLLWGGVDYKLVRDLMSIAMWFCGKSTDEPSFWACS